MKNLYKNIIINACAFSALILLMFFTTWFPNNPNSITGTTIEHVPPITLDTFRFPLYVSTVVCLLFLPVWVLYEREKRIVEG